MTSPLGQYLLEARVVGGLPTASQVTSGCMVDSADITLGEIRNAIGQGKYDDLDYLGKILLEHAWEHFETGQARSSELLSVLDTDEADTLSRLFTVYIELAGAMTENGYAAFLKDRDAIMQSTAQNSLPDVKKD